MAIRTETRILIAGGTGNVGRHLVDAVLAAGGTAIVPTRSAEKLEHFARDRDAAHPGRLELLLGDIADEQRPRTSSSAPPDPGWSRARRGSCPPDVLRPREVSRACALEAYVAAHFAVARAVIRPGRAAPRLINGPSRLSLLSGAGARLSGHRSPPCPVS